MAYSRNPGAGKGGHNAKYKTSSTPLNPIVADQGIKQFPWLKAPGAKVWTQRRIAQYLIEHYKGMGYVLDVSMSNDMDDLAMAHWMKGRAIKAMEQDPDEPMLVGQNAWQVYKASIATIQKCEARCGFTMNQRERELSRAKASEKKKQEAKQKLSEEFTKI